MYILVCLLNALIKVSAIDKAQNFCYIWNHSKHYHEGKWLKEVKPVLDPEFSMVVIVEKDKLSNSFMFQSMSCI